MRILWFTNIPMKAVVNRLGHPDIETGGWMGSLLELLINIPGIELGVASASQSDFEPFSEAGVTYFNIKVPPLLQGFRAMLHRWEHKVDFPDVLEQYFNIVQIFHPDIIHVHGSENSYGLIQGEVTIPLVISIQGILTEYVRFYLSDLRPRDILREITRLEFAKGRGLLHDYWMMQRAAERERQIIRKNRYFVGRTAWDKAFTMFCKPSALYYHCDEVLRAPFYLKTWSYMPRKRAVIYCTSSAAPYKGINCLLEAVALLRKSGSDVELRVGGIIKDTPLWPMLHKRLRELNLSETVAWLGSLDADAITGELLGASVYVLPSWIENSPNSLCEAMLVGVPCVASFVGGLPTMMRDQEEGLMFPAGDPYALADKIQQILTDPALAKKLSDQAHRTAIRRHDPQRIAKTMMEIYYKVIKSSNQKAIERYE